MSPRIEGYCNRTIETMEIAVVVNVVGVITSICYYDLVPVVGRFVAKPVNQVLNLPVSCFFTHEHTVRESLTWLISGENFM